MSYALNKDLTLDAWGCTIKLPKGTKVAKVEGAGGGFAIASEELLVELTGNTHDPHYRWLWIKPEDVAILSGVDLLPEPGQEQQALEAWERSTGMKSGY